MMDRRSRGLSTRWPQGIPCLSSVYGVCTEVQSTASSDSLDHFLLQLLPKRDRASEIYSSDLPEMWSCRVTLLPISRIMEIRGSFERYEKRKRYPTMREKLLGYVRRPTCMCKSPITKKTSSRGVKVERNCSSCVESRTRSSRPTRWAPAAAAMHGSRLTEHGKKIADHLP